MKEDTSLMNDIKDSLFDYIKVNEDRFSKLILQQKFSEIINDVMVKFYDKDLETCAVLATGILHYLLTRAIIPSQRKITINNVELDIVIPDVKTLQSNPNGTIILQILQTEDNEKLDELSMIQPVRRNIWFVSFEEINLENTYLFSVNGSFYSIINDIKKFVNIHDKNRFKIVGN